MFYEALTIAVALIVIVGIVCIALARSPAVPDIKRTNEDMNAQDAVRYYKRIEHKLLAERDVLENELARALNKNARQRGALILIRNHFAGQKSGSAVKAHRMAKQGLEG